MPNTGNNHAFGVLLNFTFLSLKFYGNYVILYVILVFFSALHDVMQEDGIIYIFDI